MKIGFVFDDSLDAPDGVQQYILMLGREYERHGHEVHYLVGETARGDIANVHSLAKNIRVKFNQNRMRIPLPASSAKIRQVLQSEKFDVLHVQMPFSPMLASKIILSAPVETRVVGTFHIAPHSQLVTIGNQILGRVTKRALKRFDFFIAASEPARDFARKTFGIDCSVIPNPVELARFSRASRAKNRGTEQKTILFLGRLVERKGCQHLLAAVKYAEQNHIALPARVIIGGDGPLRRDMENMAKSLKTPIEFRGFIDENEKPNLLANTDVAVFPATGGESFGIVLTEAMAAGAGVVLAGDNPGYRSTMADEKVLFNPNNPRELAEKISLALIDEKFASSVHAHQSKHVKQFDIVRVADEVLKTYQA